MSTQLYEELIAIGRQITCHRQRLAKPRVERLVLDRVDIGTANDELLAHLIADSLLRRIDRNLLESRSIFFQQFEIPKVLRYHRLAKAIPFITIGHEVANQFICKTVDTTGTLTVVDIGIGEGVQIRRLLRRLARLSQPPRQVDIVGLDPARSLLAACRDELARLRSKVPFPIHFRSLETTLEDLAIEQLEETIGPRTGPLAINAAFTLHHTHHQVGDTARRTLLLQRLTALEPQVLTVVEPHSNHDTENLTERIHHAWRHFSAISALIDESNLDASTLFAIKKEFFGRQARDIFGTSDHFRSERHEPYEHWLERLDRAGFEPLPVTINTFMPPYCSSSVADGLVRLSYRDQVILAVLAYCLKGAAGS